jgi:mercuric reductase
MTTTPPPPARFDLVILGGGSAAYSAAAVATAAGRTVAIVEQRAPGGTCPNHGCVPSKLFIEAAEAYQQARRPRFDSVPARPELPFDFAKLVAQKDEQVIRHRQHYEKPSVHLFRGHGRFVDSHTIAIDGGPRITGDRVLIATGARPIVPEIAGLADVPYLTSDLLAAAEPVEMAALPASILVIGGGYIGLELGQAFHRFGSRVTLLVRGGQLLNDGYEPDVRDCLGKALADEGLAVSYDADVRSVRRDGDGVAAEVAVAGRPTTLRAASLLLAVGRRPNTDGLGLEAIGVRLTEQGEVIVDAGMRTSVAHIYAAGDPVRHQHGSQEATPVANVEGQVAAHNALSLGPPKSVDLRVVPRVIFTEPQVATVGLTEAAARAVGHDVWAGQVAMENVARPWLMRQTAGLCKMVADRPTGRVLGVSLVGPQVAEAIHEAAMGLRFHATVDDFADLIHVFPAVAEAMKIVAVKMRKAR